MKKLGVTFILALLFVGAACNKASDADVDEGIQLWNELWDGYFAALESNKADPDKMVAAGQKFIDDNKAKIEKINKIFNKKGTQDQIDKVKKAIEDGQGKMETRLGDIGKHLGSQQGMTIEKIQEVAQKIQDQAKSLFDQIMA